MRPTASELWLPAPPSQPSKSLMKRAPLLYKDTHRTRTGALGSPRGNGGPATPAASENSLKSPPSGLFWYYSENSVERLALRHLGANELSGCIINFFILLVSLAVNQS